jgi:hypothetical protein
MKNPFKNNTSSRWAATIAVAMATVAVSSSANIAHRLNNSQYSTNPVTYNSGYAHYVDWSMKSNQAGHSNYDSMDGLSGSKTKYVVYTHNAVFAGQSGNAKCFSIGTSDAPYPMASTDTRIIVKNANGVWVNFSDDFHGSNFTTKFAYAQIFFYGAGQTRTNPQIRVTSYSNAYNKDAFYMNSNFLTTNFAACMDGIAALPGTVLRSSGYVGSDGKVIINRAAF